MDLKWIEQEIYNVYQQFHRDRPHVKPKEAGYLGQLWNEFDHAVTRGD